MKLKYYLRGAGIGFIVSAILFAVFLTALDWGPRQGHVSNQEATEESMIGDTVKEAEEKKKVEEQLLEETQEVKEVDTNVDTAKPDDIPNSEEKVEEKPEVKFPTQTKTDEEVKPATNNNTDENTKPADDKKVTGNVKFSIKDGEASNTVANNLQSLGLVDDAKAFDQFLSENGYDHRLRTGEFNISTGMSYKELAELLCKKQ